ncbi:hypothetical protein MOV08_43525 [Streptomyces yunnanensis]|uniref:Uncharacterized protein n=1 Tax=Streptomyces yunnanensis TaxID=156453 RepID=A0ABY8API5_9ACTN|nr:hypothetical protein [Streptomyces yunnanensis]WEB37940.1 hypothetical protein MOV08_00440 [Streptomyces yunnanensis]WEB45482.1 hypothetical protein MOV08_43525 [Streptomyces yunnanensis]
MLEDLSADADAEGVELSGAHQCRVQAVGATVTFTGRREAYAETHPHLAIAGLISDGFARRATRRKNIIEEVLTRQASCWVPRELSYSARNLFSFLSPGSPVLPRQS